MPKIRRTPELDRILKISRRQPTLAENIRNELTELLKTPEGTQRLREVQARALFEIGTYRGLFGPIGVGEGKTLITLLAGYVLDGKRVLLLLPATLVHKTRRELKKYAKDWNVDFHGVLPYSYEMLGRVQAAEMLKNFAPDVIVCDEVHKLKNRHAAVTRRVARYLDEFPETVFIALTGTIMRKSLLDFAHLLRWSLKENAPVPRTVEETEEWALALDEDTPDEARYEPGALLLFASEEDMKLVRQGLLTETQAARRGFQRRLMETPGVVSAMHAEDVDCSILIRAITYEMSRTTDQHFQMLRGKKRTPDDWELMTGAEVHLHAKQLALGFCSAWDPHPPDWWLDARRNWCSFVREVLSRSRTLDSPEQVANAIDDGKLDDSGVLNAWRQAKPKFPVNVVFHWHDDSALKVCLEWMKKNVGVVWVEHVAFGQRLSELSGCKYYGAKGLASDGEFIDDADPKKCAIASIDANKEGRNLQEKWSRCLYTSLGNGPDEFQQSIGRFHRSGQDEDEVVADILLGCAEHAKAWQSVYTGAQTIFDMTGEKQKVLIADIDWPEESEIAAYQGARWRVVEEPTYIKEERWKNRFSDALEMSLNG